MKLRSFLLLIFVLMLVVFLIGCASTGTSVDNAENTEEESTEESSEDASGELRVAINAQPPTLDPHVSTATIIGTVGSHFFEPLVTINSNYQPQPMLAESFETSEDGKTIIFHLREGVKFHNGKEMTSEDVVASMNRWQEYSSRAKAAFGNAEFKADGDYTVLLELEKPNRTALSVMSSYVQLPAIMPKEVIDSAGEDGITELIGTGPYKFEEWKQDQYIKLTKFDDFQPRSEPSDGPAGKKEALVEDIYFMIVTDSSTRVAGVQSGEYDIANEIPFDNYDQLEEAPNVNTYIAPTGFDILVFNKKEGIFTEKKMRQAVAAALDMEAILQASLSNERFYKLNPGLMLEEQTDWYTRAGEEYYNQKDPEKAKQLLQEAGYDGEPVTFLTSREYETHYNSSVVISEQLDQIGMNVELDLYDWATVKERRQDPSAYDAFVTGFSINTDPTQYTFLDSANEWDGWTNNPEIDRLLDDIRAAESQEEAKTIYEELQTVVLESVPAIRFGDKSVLYAVSKDVEGFQHINSMILWNVKKQ